MHKPVVIKSTKKIIAESNDTYYFKHRLFPQISLGESIDGNTGRESHAIRHSFYDDIAKKYGVNRELVGRYLKQYSEEVIRSLAVFGEHMYIIDNIKIENQGSY